MSATSDFKSKQTKWLQELPENEKALLKSYTSLGDTILNNVMQGGAYESIEKQIVKFRAEYPEFFPDTKIGLVPSYVNAFLAVANKAPLVERELTVYRGVKREEDILPTRNVLLSTSIHPVVAYDFSGKSRSPTGRYLKVIVKPGVRAVYIAPISAIPKEGEILILPPFDIRKEKFEPPEGFRSPLVPDYVVTISPKAPYVRKAGTRRRMPKSKSRRRRN